MNSKDLMQKKFHRSPWLIDGLIRLGRQRMSIFAGKPGAGKSSFAWQCAVSLSKGIPILGRGTTRCESLYLCTEETDEDIQTILLDLGYDPATDEAIHITAVRIS
jgi:hypothetical protein